MENIGSLFLAAVSDNNSTFMDKLNAQEMTIENRILFIIGGSIVAIATSFLILGAFKFRELRKQPGDLILCVAIFDLMLALHWVSLAIYSLGGPIANDEIFCQINGALGTLAGANEYLYNVCFSLFLVESMRNALKQDKIPKKSFHVVSLTVSIFGTLFMLYKGKIGKTFAGTCSIKSSHDPSYGPSASSLAGPLIAFSYAVLGGFTYRYIKKNAPKCATAHSKRSEFLIYYNRYIKFASFIFLAIAGLNFATFVLGTELVPVDVSVSRLVTFLFNPFWQLIATGIMISKFILFFG